jgi:AraC-like DNA-binding protein
MHNVIDSDAMHLDLYRMVGGTSLAGCPDIRVTRLGDFSGKGSFHAQERKAKTHDVVVVLRGSGTMRIGERRFVSREGDIAVFFPGLPVEYRETRTRPWRYTWFTLEGRGASAALAQVGFTTDTPLRRNAHPAGIDALFAEIRAAFRTDTHTPVFPHVMAWRLVEALTDRPERVEPGRTPLSLARELIRTYGIKGVSLKLLCSRTGVSRSSLYRSFLQECGMTPKAYIDSARMEEAERLLRETFQTIAQVAEQVGYSSPTYFCRAFRRYHGCSPRTFAGR